MQGDCVHTVETRSSPGFHVCPSTPDHSMTEEQEEVRGASQPSCPLLQATPPLLTPTPSPHPTPDYPTCEYPSTLRFLSRDRLLFLALSSSFSLRSCSARASKSLFLRRCLAACAMALVVGVSVALACPDLTAVVCGSTALALYLAWANTSAAAVCSSMALQSVRACSPSASSSSSAVQSHTHKHTGSPHPSAVGCYCSAALFRSPSLSLSPSCFDACTLLLSHFFRSIPLLSSFLVSIRFCGEEKDNSKQTAFPSFSVVFLPYISLLFTALMHCETASTHPP